MQRIRAYLALFLLGLSATAAAQLDTASWIMVDTATQTLTVMEGDHIKKVFSNISVGRNGPADYRTQGSRYCEGTITRCPTVGSQASMPGLAVSSSLRPTP